MKSQMHDLRTKIRDSICEEILACDSDNVADTIHLIVGVLEDIKIGLIHSTHEAGKSKTEKDIKNNPSKVDEFMEKHRKKLEELLKKSKMNSESDDGESTTTTA